ncbi:tRNA methyltransferase [Candidatus Pacearchaeota archaeon CG06_land_8_20_14_3_00_35_12]|nr:MAG: tRNA methyltransferase [Candidatus Pacearchaeota archaeon CG06_land_8_20_14_3_00_35_12]
MFQPKPEFEKRMQELLGEETEEYFKIIHKELPNWIRCNTLKISPNALINMLKEKGWKIKQPFSSNKEIILVESELKPGELGNSVEHQKGLFYVQDLASMMPAIALEPSEKDFVLDLCSAPGSKTTQIAALMKNSGLLIANEFDFARAKVLMENLERCSVSNEIVIRHDAEIICQKLKELKIIPKKILVDAPCSGEGTIRGSPETLKTWNSNMIKHFSLIQKRIASAALNLLQPGGELVYSTCTHAPEENEAVLQHLLENFNIKIEPLKLPMKTRHAVLEWLDDEFEEQIINAARIYPQDNDSEGFFLAKIIKISDKEKK